MHRRRGRGHGLWRATTASLALAEYAGRLGIRAAKDLSRLPPVLFALPWVTAVAVVGDRLFMPPPRAVISRVASFLLPGPAVSAERALASSTRRVQFASGAGWLCFRCQSTLERG